MAITPDQARKQAVTDKDIKNLEKIIDKMLVEDIRRGRDPPGVWKEKLPNNSYLVDQTLDRYRAAGWNIKYLPPDSDSGGLYSFTPQSGQPYGR